MPLSYLGLAKWFIAVVSALLLTGLARSTAQGQTLLMGGGATFPHPIYARWIAEEYRAKRGMAILHFPTVLGADVPIYNIPGVAGELKFTPEALVGIFLGKITKWDDQRLTKTNLEAKLPKHDIVVAFWSDGSGTTYIWTDYLAKVSEEWNSDIGFGTTVPWPAPGESAYPISSFTWLLVPAKFDDKNKLRVMKDFLQWISTDGQKLTQELLYVPLPAEVVAQEQAAFSKIQ